MPMKIWGVNADNIFISKLIDTKNNSKYLIGYLDDVLRQLILILPKMSRNVQTFKDKDGDEDKNKNYKLMSFHIDNDKLLEKYKTILTNIEDLQNIQLNALPVYDDRYITTKIRTYGDKIYTNFRGSNVPEDPSSETFRIISIDPYFVYENKYYLQVYLDNCIYKNVGKQIIDYLNDNIFKSREDFLFFLISKNKSYKCCITIELI